LCKSKKRLLVIDDDPTVLFAVRKLLLSKNIDIDTSESLDEAIQFIDKNTYQIIITDLAFSETVDNAGIAISYYARKKNPKVAIVLWTAKDISEISEKILNADIDLCIPKPIAPNVIFTIVEKISACRTNHHDDLNLLS
jgi:two-component system, LytTR family, response regulator LytT